MRCREKPSRRARRGGSLRGSRRGVAALETALILLLFFTLVLGMLDLGLAVFRYHVLAHGARETARHAIVRGSLAERLGKWGPEPYEGAADEEHPIAEVVRRAVAGFDPAEVTVSVTWPDGHQFNDPVHVSVTAPHQPMVLFLFQQTITLRAESTMIIAH